MRKTAGPHVGGRNPAGHQFEHAAALRRGCSNASHGTIRAEPFVIQPFVDGIACIDGKVEQHLFKLDMARWPLITAVDAACMALETFQKAAPAVQPDAS